MKYCFYEFIYLLLLIIIFSLPLPSQQLEVSVKTDSYGGAHFPRNGAVLWIQKPNGEFINTIMVWGLSCNEQLKEWREATGLMDTGTYDGITAATRPNHDSILHGVWNLKDTANQSVPYGDYEFWVEMLEDDYHWKQINPFEEYYGLATKGTISIDGVKKTVPGLDTCAFFSQFTATYTPEVGIIPQEHQKINYAGLHITYGPLRNKVFFTLKGKIQAGLSLYLFNVQGQIATKLKFVEKQACWQGPTGKTQGTYLFALYVPEKALLLPMGKFTLYY